MQSALIFDCMQVQLKVQISKVKYFFIIIILPLIKFDGFHMD